MKKRIKKGYRKAKLVVYRQTILEPIDHLWTFIGAFIGIGAIAYMHSNLNQFMNSDRIFLIGSFGASAVLVYGATNSPLAQPRNLIGGHLISAIIGVTVGKLIGSYELLWLSASLAVSLSIVFMQVSKTLHPPGGATALIAVIGSEKIKSMGYYYVLNPVLSGVLVLFVVAVAVNNIPKDRNYPYRN